MQILVAEDEVSLAKALKRILEKKGYFVDMVHDGATALDYAQGMSYQLIILDVMLPEMDGFAVVRELRRTRVNTPILMLTARTTTTDKVTGLNFGADDYMTKPFDPEELLARVGALTRRTGEVVVDKLVYEDLRLELQSATLSCGEETVQLSHKEFEVLKTLLCQPSMTISTDMLIVNVWGVESEATDNNVEVYISFIRKKLKYLHSRVGIKKLQKIGYRLEVNPC